MMHGFKQEVPVDPTAKPLTEDERGTRHYQYRVLELIIDAARKSDVEEVKRLADLM